MSDIVIYGGAILCALLLGAVFFGAPYVPTLRRDMLNLFTILEADDVLVDLGSGDGRLVKAAAQKGMKTYGYELSPLLALWSWLSLGSARYRAKIKWANYWHEKLPADTTVVFVFLAERYMPKLRIYLEDQSRALNHPLTLVSYGFTLPGYTPVRTVGPMIVYRIQA